MFSFNNKGETNQLLNQQSIGL